MEKLDVTATTEWLTKPDGALCLPSSLLLPEFEDLVVKQVWPVMTTEEQLLWASREALLHLIRPPKYYGVIADVQLTPHEDAYDRLMDAPERGLKLHGRKARPKGTTYSLEVAAKQTKGFALTAKTQNLNGSSVDIISTEVWYVPNTNAYSSQGRVLRHVAQPNFTVAQEPMPIVSDYRGVSPARFIDQELKNHNPLSYRSTSRIWVD